jgi:hypothetical protein
MVYCVEAEMNPSLWFTLRRVETLEEAREVAAMFANVYRGRLRIVSVVESR